MKNHFIKSFKNLKILPIVIIAVLAFGAGYILKPGGHSATMQMGHNEAAATEKAPEFWTCSMHPHIHQSEPGSCPLCGMDLIPVYSESEDVLGPRELKLSAAAQKLAAVEVAPVERKFVENEIRMVGKVEYSETRLSYITAWVPGRLDRLYVDYTGIAVNKGDHLAYLYSPELLAAQEELIQALATVKNLENSDITMIKDRAFETVETIREKLRLWGLSPEQIQDIEQNEKPEDHLTIYAPVSGIVIHKNALEGMYVDFGTQIYTIADLSEVWVKLDAYESDLSWIRYGQEVEFETEAYPGEPFHGTIAFIDPVLSEKTRTVKVRVNVQNQDGRLKPGMFTRAIVRSKTTSSGKVVDASLAGKWIGPMHPEIIKAEPGNCEICGMPLVSTKSLGYESPQTAAEQAPLVIPASSPLITGKRAVVYVRLDAEEGRFEGREIVLGPRTGDYYIVREGLEEGEMVVVQGNFKIDSAMQILAKPSMMNPKGGGPTPGHNHGDGTMAPPPKAPVMDPKGREHSGHSNMVEPMKMEIPVEFQSQLFRFYESYLKIPEALANDDLESAKNVSRETMIALNAVAMKLLKGQAHIEWMGHLMKLKEAGELFERGDIESVRKGLVEFSAQLPETVKQFGAGGLENLFVLRCPMAENGKGAIWLQTTEQTRNPFFGSKMLTCGSVIETLVDDSQGNGGNPIE